MRTVFLLAIIFFIGLASASSVTCVVLEDRVLVEIELDNGDSVVLPGDISLVEENSDKVSFISRDFVRKDGEHIFALPVIIDSSYDLEVILPSGHFLSEGFVYPKDYEISSDGKSIILGWKNVSEEVIVFYDGHRDFDYFYWIGIFCIVVAAFLFFRFREKRFGKELARLNKEAALKKKVSREKELTRNLFGEEKEIVEFLVKRKSCWMKDLVRSLGMSKVMATRKIRSLVEKGLISKESFGREYRLSLVKKVS